MILFLSSFLSSSSSSSVVASSANILVVLRVLEYNKFIVFGSIFFLSILPELDSFAPNHQPLHFCCCCYFCFQVPCCSVAHFAFLSYCARIHPFPAQEPYGRLLCFAFIEAPDMVCASSRPTFGMCVLFMVLGWHLHLVWYTSCPHEYKYERLLCIFIVLE